MPETRQHLESVPTYPAGAPHRIGRLGADTRIGTHRHTQGQLVYAVSGALATTTERGTWVAPANRVTWTPPGFQHAHRGLGGTDVRIIVIPGELSQRLPDQPSVFEVGPLLREGIVALTSRPVMNPEAYARLRAVILDELIEARELPKRLPEPQDDRLRAVAELLDADPAQTTTLAEFGRAVGASERTLSRLLRTEFGMSFPRWRTILRVHHGIVRLDRGHSVTDTANACGWSNPSSFIEAFTAVMGQTPGSYQLGVHGDASR
ncbi:helix-turn-helix domain-containing protein [Mycobacterium sp. PSTR-4-N]|uniref:AraC family transcriptional regulator n=1 Tax=Mycobacterium sp. PSTR-4-N TaxID=2917745 RepID=UPI001F1562CF|nr:helix-turn-helix transcriptional regulator [Mycobacterium sp. PSTR-4-N]MCG7594185.1 helix-turn-helix transcriptional regulator [Mycobacterium sp. PSTR-4-N]